MVKNAKYVMMIGIVSLFFGASIIQADIPQTVTIENQDIESTNAGNIFYPTDDSGIVQQYPANTPGALDYMTIVNEDDGGGTGWARDALVKFDISSLPTEGIILSAIFRLYYYDWGDTNPAGRPLTCYRITSDWDEATVSWNTRPSYASTPTASTPVPSSTNIWIEWDVQSDVEEFIDGTYTNYGWRVADETSWGGPSIPRTRTRSKEYGQNPPELEITILNPKKAILIGSVSDLIVDDEVTYFNAVNLRFLQLGPISFNKYTAGEEIVVTGSRIGILSPTFVLGVFNAGLI